MDPAIDQFAKKLAPDVTFEKIPAMHAPNSMWMVHARLFYALDYLGKEKELHKDLFVAVQEDGGTDEDGHALAGLVTLESMVAFATAHGISQEEFEKAYNSPEVQMRMDQALRFIDNLKIPSVPAMAVNGRWAFTLQGNKGQGFFFQTAERLLSDDRAALAASGGSDDSDSEPSGDSSSQ
jgi:hypothetical protein